MPYYLASCEGERYELGQFGAAFFYGGRGIETPFLHTIRATGTCT